MSAKLHSRRMFRKLVKEGTARLFIENTFSVIKGVLMNGDKSPVLIFGKVTDPSTTQAHSSKSGSIGTTTINSRMRITVIDGKTAEKFEVRDVPVTFYVIIDELTGSVQVALEIVSQAINFVTSSVDVDAHNESANADPKQAKMVLLGAMSLKVILNKKPSYRRAKCIQGMDTIMEETCVVC